MYCTLIIQYWLVLVVVVACGQAVLGGEGDFTQTQTKRRLGEIGTVTQNTQTQTDTQMMMTHTEQAIERICSIESIESRRFQIARVSTFSTFFSRVQSFRRSET